MHDEFRVRVEVGSDEDAKRLLKQLERDAGADAPKQRVAVSREGEDVYLYADDREGAERERAAVEAAVRELGLDGEVAMLRWHPDEERWEDAAAPLPQDAEAIAAEHDVRDAAEDAESEALGMPQWEVRISVPSRGDARELQQRLESEGIPVVRRFRHLLVGAADEDQANELAERLRSEAPPGSEVRAELNEWLEYERRRSRYAYFGGLGG